MNDDSTENKAIKRKIMLAQTGLKKSRVSILSKNIGSLPKNIGSLFLNIFCFFITGGIANYWAESHGGGYYSLRIGFFLFIWFFIMHYQIIRSIEKLIVAVEKKSKVE